MEQFRISEIQKKIMNASKAKALIKLSIILFIFIVYLSIINFNLIKDIKFITIILVSICALLIILILTSIVYLYYFKDNLLNKEDCILTNEKIIIDDLEN